MEFLGIATANKWTAVVAICWLLKEIIPFFFKRNPSTIVETTNIQGENMQTVQVILEVPKESKEVLDAVTALISDVKAKKPLAEIIAGALPKVIAAVDGFDMLDDEAKSANKGDLIGYAGKEIVKALGV